MSNTKDKEIISQEVRAFFKNIPWKKILAFLFFVLLSCIFWMMQVFRQKFDFTLDIPVKYVNVPDSIIFETELPPHFEARVRDDGYTIFRYFLTRRNDSLVVDVRDIIRGSQDRTIQGRNFEQFVQTKLFQTTDLLSYSPTRVSYTFALLQEKQLPVIYNGKVNLSPGYMLDGDLIIQPDSVRVYGSKASIDTLSYAYTVSDTLNDITSERQVTIQMKPIRGIRYVPHTVNLTVPVDEFLIKEVEVPIKCINLPSNLDIKFFPSTVKIPFFVGKKRFDLINSDNFEVKIDYDDIKDFNGSSIPVRITDSPDYVRTKVPIPAEVEYILEQK